jgi:hypothetical protein
VPNFRCVLKNGTLEDLGERAVHTGLLLVDDKLSHG